MTNPQAGLVPEAAPPGGGRTVVLVDDDAGLVPALRHNLELDGHRVVVLSPAAVAQAAGERLDPHLLIISLAAVESHPDPVLDRLREGRAPFPVLVLARSVVEASRVAGFRLGFDDFVVRPVPVGELHRRIDECLSRVATAAPRASAPPRIRFADVEVLVGSRQVLRGGRPVDLRAKEFDLLMALVARDGRVIHRTDLLREVWGYRGWVATRTIDTHIAELRRKLERNPARPEHILTVRKVGYRFRSGAGPAS